MAHAAVRSALGFGVARFALGLGKASNFPAAAKTVAEWFPKKERALATGIFNAGSNVGAIAAPLLVPPIAIYFGWRWAFIVSGLLGFVWLALWLVFHRRPEERDCRNVACCDAGSDIVLRSLLHMSAIVSKNSLSEA